MHYFKFKSIKKGISKHNHLIKTFNLFFSGACLSLSSNILHSAETTETASLSSQSSIYDPQMAIKASKHIQKNNFIFSKKGMKKINLFINNLADMPSGLLLRGENDYYKKSISQLSGDYNVLLNMIDSENNHFDINNCILDVLYCFSRDDLELYTSKTLRYQQQLDAINIMKCEFNEYYQVMSPKLHNACQTTEAITNAYKDIRKMLAHNVI